MSYTFQPLAFDTPESQWWKHPFVISLDRIWSGEKAQAELSSVRSDSRGGTSVPPVVGVLSGVDGRL
jgi:hypothetical protein